MRRSALYVLAIGAALVAPLWLQLTLSGEEDSVAAVPAKTVIAVPPLQPQPTQESQRLRTPARRAVKVVPRPRKHAAPKRTAAVSSPRPAPAEPAVLIAAPRPDPVQPAPPPKPPARPDKPSDRGETTAAPSPPPPAPPPKPKPTPGDAGAAPAPTDAAKPKETPAAPPTAPQAADDDDAVAGAASMPDLASMSDEELSKWVDDLVESSLGDLAELDDD